MRLGISSSCHRTQEDYITSWLLGENTTKGLVTKSNDAISSIWDISLSRMSHTISATDGLRGNLFREPAAVAAPKSSPRSG